MPAPADPSAALPAELGSSPPPADRYRAILHHVQQGFFLVEVLFDAQGTASDYRFLEVNPAFERQMGLAAAVGRTLRELVPALDARWFAPYGQVARTGQPQQFEQPAPQGQRWYEVHALAGGPAGSHQVAILLADATARHQAEAAQQHSSQLLLDMEAVAHTGSYAADLASGGFYFSDGMYRLFGEVPGAFVPTLALIDARSHPEDAATVRQVLDAATRTGQPYTYRRRIRRTDGAWRTLEAHGEVRRDAAGQAVQLRGLVQDITERVQAEQALHESRALLRATIDSSLDIVQVFEAVRDEQGAVVDFAWVLNNAAAEQYYGDVLGQRLCELNPGVVAEGIFDTFRQVLETGVPDQRERRYVHEQFDGWFHQSTVKLGDGVTTTTRDISERKQAHKEILRLKDELAQQATDKYHTLFRSMDQGFCVLEILFDDTGQHAVGFKALEVNPRFAQESGMVAYAAGNTTRELVPALDGFWLAAYGQVVRTGEAHRLERYEPQVNRWFDVHAFRIGPPTAHQVAVLFTNITARKQAEQRQQFLLNFSDALRAEPNADAVANRALALLIGQLELDRSYITTYHLNENRAAVDYQLGNARVAPLPAYFVLSDYPEAFANTLQHTVVIEDDFERQGLAEAEQRNSARLGMRAMVAATLRKEDKPLWSLVAISARPRRWAPGEIALVEEVAERTLAAMEHAHAKEALTASEEQFRAVANLVPDLLWRSTSSSDTTWYNQRWYEYTGQTPETAAGYGWTDVIHPADQAASSRRYHAALTAGQPLHQEHRIRSAGGEYRWFQVQARPVRNAHGEITAWFGAATDIHARKLAELRLRRNAEIDALRVKLGDALHSLSDVADLQSAPARLLRDWLDAGWCYYDELDDTGTKATVLCDAVRAGLPSLVGMHDLAAAPAYTAHLRAGKVLSVPDIRASDLFSPPITARYVALGMQAALGVPLVKDGQLRAVLVVADTAPRTWPEEAVALLQEVAERTWAAVERARAKEALAASEQRLRALITNLPGAAAFVVGPDLRYQLAGGEALDAAGLTPADLLGRTVAEAMPPVLVPQYEAHYRQVLAGQDFSLEHTSHGRTFISRGVPLRGKADQPEAALVVSYDITARKQAEAALSVSELKYRTLFESMDQGFGIGQVLPADEAAGKPLDWQWLEVNPQFERLTGLPRAAMLSQTTRQLLPGLQESWYERYAQAATGETVNFEAFSPVLGRWFDVYAFALGPPATRRVAVLFSNTSEQKQVEAALRGAEARYREQLEEQVVERTQQLQESRDLLQSVLDTSLISMSVLYAVRDEAGQVLDFRLGLVNKELERKTGRTDLVGKLYAQEYPGIRQVGIFDLMLRALATGEPQGMEYFYDHEGLSRWFTCQFVKMGDGVAATTLDITERKIAEQERLRNLRLLEQAEAVAGLGSWDYELATGAMRWSDGMYHLFGLPVGSTVAPSHYLEAVLPDDRPRARQLVRRLTAGKGFEETLRLRVREHVKTVRMKAVVLRNETGQPMRVLGVDLDISELQRLEADNLHLRLGQQQGLFEAVQLAQEEERRRMAESLHNGLGQVLFAAKLQLDRLGAEPGPPARLEAARLLSDAIRQTRALSHELSPTLLEEFGLQVALETICRQLNAPNLHWRCHIVVADAVLPSVLQLAIYRLAQGLAHNVAQHAQASEATLEVERLPGWVVLRVEDNGRGFDPATVREGLGLKTLHSRAALLGGVVQLDSAPSRGTQVLVRLPVQ